MVMVRIPTPLRGLCGGAAQVETAGGDLAAVIAELEDRHAGIRNRLCDENGSLRRFVNIYVNGEDIRFLAGLSTVVEDGDDVSIVPAIAGG
ncbi:MAG: MoaD/ThiS family protein [Peptococcaceae bacterium]|jgi:molybdopterin synthase sulfur carrier subunit|nr:MoaD/ThiS family protein [Peptococcaceae bacterium]